MAVVLDAHKFTKKQIDAAEPLIRTIEKYDRQIAAEKVCSDVISEPYEKAKLRRDRIANIETKKKAVMRHLESILNARNEYDKKFNEASAMVDELERIKNTWGF